MTGFLLKGLLRDRSRSLFPTIVVMTGVMLTVVLYSWIQGAGVDMIRAGANFATGHVRIMTRAYAEEANRMPNDLAYIGVAGLLTELRRDYPDLIWQSRTHFGGLLDVPDSSGETRSQGPVAGFAVDLFSPDSRETQTLNLEHALVRGRLPAHPGEVVLTDEFARRLGIEPGATATLIGSTMDGGMTTANFTVVGTVRFGIGAMDRGAMIADIADVQQALDMPDAAGEVLGLFPEGRYNEKRMQAVAADFNSRHPAGDDFAPVMRTLLDEGGFASSMTLFRMFTAIITFVFVLAMSLVLWNAGLLGSLRRYGEFGLRLAIGENKGHVYRSLIAESLLIGVGGAAAGTVLGLLISFYLQKHGFNATGMMQNASMMMPDVFRAQVTPGSFVIGFIPGIAATLLGAAISGLGIYRRDTAKLAKELES